MATNARIRRVIGTALAMAAIAAATFGVATPAEAAPQVLLVSSDGIHFSPALAGGLFDSAGMLVPGDSTTTRFWVKNPTASAASVQVTIGQLVTPSTEFAENVTLEAWNSASKSTVSRRWAQLSDCGILVSPRVLSAGGTIEVDLTITMLDASATRAQHQTASLNAVVAMRDASAGTPSAPGCGATADPSIKYGPLAFTGGSMAYTGTDFPSQLVLGGAVLLGVGGFLMVLRRRRRDDDEEKAS